MLFASHSPTLRGGAERCLLELVEALQNSGTVECCVSVPAHGELAVALEEIGVPVHVARTPSWTIPNLVGSRGQVWKRQRHKVRQVAAILVCLRRYRSLLRTIRPDVVVTNTATIPTPALASTRERIRHIWWIHEFVTLDHRMQYLLGEPRSHRIMDRLSDAVVVNSDAVRAHFLPAINPAKVSLIYCGIRRLTSAPNVLDRDAVRLLLLGNQGPTKGTELAVRAVGTLRREHPEVKVILRLVGSMSARYQRRLGGLSASLAVSDIVEFVSFTADPTPHIEWSNIVLMCSPLEAFGRVTVEALKSGRPVVAARSGGTPEIVADGIDGLLFKPDDIDDLAGALHALCSTPSRLSAFSDAARLRASTRFLMEDEVAQFSDILHRGVARKQQ